LLLLFSLDGSLDQLDVEGEENNMKDSENEDETENEGNTTPFSRRKNRV